MKQPNFTQIHDVMKASGMIVFDTPFSMTLGGIRTKDNSANTFNDWGFMSYFDKEGKLHGIIEPITTDAGLYYRENPININGTAIICHGMQHIGAYQYQNPKEDPNQPGHKGQECFKQVVRMSYWRDANRDKYLDFDGPVYKELAATNGHDMGTLGKEVNKWSAGCWGSTQEVMDKFYELARLQIRMGVGDKFSYAMLHENMF